MSRGIVDGVMHAVKVVFGIELKDADACAVRDCTSSKVADTKAAEAQRMAEQRADDVDDGNTPKYDLFSSSYYYNLSVAWGKKRDELKKQGK